MDWRQELLFYAPVPAVVLLGICAHLFHRFGQDGGIFARIPVAVRPVAITAGALLIVILSGDTRPFIYFRF